jgi:hypothetical protein
MTSTHTLDPRLHPWALPPLRVRALALQGFLLVAAAWLLPAAAHLAGFSGRVLLPMHWPVVFAGLCYGWRSGALIGLGAPSLAFLLSGMPPAFVLPAMTLELAAYGFIAGYLREGLHRGWFVSAFASIVGGRLVFLAVAIATGAVTTTFAHYLSVALLPGLPAALGQAILLPLLAGWWVRREHGR